MFNAYSQFHWAHLWRFILIILIASILAIQFSIIDAETYYETRNLGALVYLPVPLDILLIYYLVSIKRFKNFSFKTNDGSDASLFEGISLWFSWRWRFILLILSIQFFLAMFMALSLEPLNQHTANIVFLFILGSSFVLNFTSLTLSLSKLNRKKKLIITPVS